MNKQWQEYCEKYLVLTSREQYLILLSGLVAILFITFYIFIDAKMIENKKSVQTIATLKSTNQSSKLSILEHRLASVTVKP